MTNQQVNLDTPESLLQPARYFADARERGDVQWSDHHNAWIVLSHAEAEAGLRDADVLSSDKTGSFQRAAKGRGEAFQRAADMLSGWMNFRDPPVHTRLREPVRLAFTPRRVASLESEVRAIVDGVLDALPAGEADLSHHFARPIPALVIGAVLGVPAEDRQRFYRWSHDLGQMVFSVNPGGAPEDSVSAAATEFIAFFAELIERERREPAGSVLSAVIAEAGDLTPIELIGACTLLLFGGHETTTTLLVNAVGMLLDEPDRLSFLRQRPKAMDSAIEEFMRVQGPARALSRKVRVAHERGGQQLRPGQNVFLCVASANHDPAVFVEPERVDLERTPNPHLGFGWGLHYCLGSSLARLEAGIALRSLIERFPRLEAIGEVPAPRASALGYGRRPLRARLR
jgi:cytochrome P450